MPAFAGSIVFRLIDTGYATYRGRIPDAVLYRLPLDEAYAESERNWRCSLQEIADSDDPQVQIFVAEDGTGAVIGLAMGGPPKHETLLPNSGEISSHLLARSN
ncbi:MAG TPA: hypothetical protein DCL15_19690 [Chloroflexi bacterium]|nr:hypothetical protein [Chloroflexota bacterium]